MSINNFKMAWFGWNGYFGKFLLFWNKHQKWWWIGVCMIIMVWSAYDAGQLFTRANILSGTQNVKGTISLNDVLEKSKKDAGRLLIVSSSEARYIDQKGFAWNVPNFAENANKKTMKELKDNHVNLEGGFSVQIKPVKTDPSDLLISTLTDLLLKFLIIGFYGVVFFFIMRMLTKQKVGQYKKVNINNKPDVDINDVAGYDGIKDELFEVIDYLKKPEKFSRLGAKPPRGVLLYGPPGNGKTLLAKALAGEAEASFFEQSASSFIQIFAGQGAKSVRQLFDQARKNKPSVIFIDEIDAIGSVRSNNSHDERIQTLNAILTEMDGFSNNTGIVVVAATNRVETLDKALVRPGRFDRKVMISMPTLNDRYQILCSHAKNIKFDKNVDWHYWAGQTRGFSGAELAALINESAIEAARDDSMLVSNNHITLARDRVWVGAKNKGQVLSNKEKHIIAVHELGHAWMRLYTGGRVEKVSIAPRGLSLGVTISVSNEEKFLNTKEDIFDELLILMGGRASEKAILDNVTGGAYDDMQKASDMARKYILSSGSEKWGSYIPSKENLNIEDEASKMVNKAFEKACSVINENKNNILKAVSQLEIKEELTEMELQDIWSVKK